jgi:hypothetical protein
MVISETVAPAVNTQIPAPTDQTEKQAPVKHNTVGDRVVTLISTVQKIMTAVKTAEAEHGCSFVTKVVRWLVGKNKGLL